MRESSNQPCGYLRIDPRVLAQHGIWGDPKSPEHALRRARGHVAQGQYQSARALLDEFISTSHGETYREMLELKARCAMRSPNGSWQALLNEILRLYELAGDVLGAARIHKLLGEMQTHAACFREAWGHFKQARQAFVMHHRKADVAIVDCHRAWLAFRLHHSSEALQTIDAALRTLGSLGQTRPEGNGRLQKAMMLIELNRHQEAAIELVAASRLLDMGGNAADGLRVRLTRAQALLARFEEQRALDMLLRLQSDIERTEDMTIHAWCYQLLGRAYRSMDPVLATSSLMQARDLYQGLQRTYDVAACNSDLEFLNEPVVKPLLPVADDNEVTVRDAPSAALMPAGEESFAVVANHYSAR